MTDADLEELDRLSATMCRAFPDGTMDKSTYSDIEFALDRADAPSCGNDGRWLTLPERIAVLVEQLQVVSPSDIARGADRLVEVMKRTDGHNLDPKLARTLVAFVLAEIPNMLFSPSEG